MAYFTKEVYPRLAKRQLKTNGRLANRGLTSLVKEAIGKLANTSRLMKKKTCLLYKEDFVLRFKKINEIHKKYSFYPNLNFRQSNASLSHAKPALVLEYFGFITRRAKSKPFTLD